MAIVAVWICIVTVCKLAIVALWSCIHTVCEMSIVALWNCIISIYNSTFVWKTDVMDACPALVARGFGPVEILLCMAGHLDRCSRLKEFPAYHTPFSTSILLQSMKK